MTLCLVFFFFQAEDGIRDDLVTGVQTCALPISLGFGQRSCRSDTQGPSKLLDRAGIETKSVYGGEVGHTYDGPVADQIRSEERRVGEEGRSRWSPYH